ncbi:MAG: PAS domain-containing protein [Steroidobacteraceae bacterium]
MELSELIAMTRDQQHESGFRLLADWLPQMIWTCDADGVCDYLSRRWEDYTGLPAEQQLGLEWLTQVHPDDRNRLLEAWKRSVATGDALRVDFRIRRYDGIYHWFDTRSMPVRDTSGRVIKWFGSNTDIQERIDMREALLLSEQRFRGLYHSAPVSIWQEDWSIVLRELQLLRATGVKDFAAYFAQHPEFVQRMLELVRVVDVNDWTLNVFRAQLKEQLLGPLNWLFATPAALQGFVTKLEYVARGDRSALLEMELCAFDGGTLHVLSGMVMPSPQTDPGLMLVSRVDITEHHRSEAALRQQQVLLNRMSSLAKVGGWSFDVDTRAGTWTDEVARIYDLPANSTLSAAERISFFKEDSRIKLQTAIQQAAKHAQPYDLELQLISATLSSKWIRAQGMPIVEAGRVVRVEGAIQDITERKQAELALQAVNASLEQQVAARTSQLELARSNLQNILDALPSMVGYWDSGLKLRFANRVYQEMVGKPAAKLLGRHYAEIFGAAQFEDRRPYLEAALNGELRSAEMRVIAPDGSRSQDVQAYYVPDHSSGVVRGVYVLVIDITNLKKAEAALRAANDELEAFTYAVAHDLRAPLRALDGFSRALLEDCGSSLDEEGRDFANEISRASRRMGDLLEGLLVLSRSTQGSLQFKRVDLQAIAEHIRDELQQQDPQRKIDWQIAPGLHAFGDARMLELVLRNLLGNAWKYTQKTEQACIRFDAVNQASTQMFRVTDNGAGFDMAHADRLFKPFQRLHRQDEFIGIGIGLATVQRIVRRHGGEITANAAPGKGACFRFTLGDPAKGDEV